MDALRQHRISSLSATSYQALEPVLKQITLASYTLIRQPQLDFKIILTVSRMSSPSFPAVACQDLVTRLSAPEASIMPSIILTAAPETLSGPPLAINASYIWPYSQKS